MEETDKEMVQRRRRLRRLVAVPIAIALVVAIGLYWTITSYLLKDAEDKLKTLVLTQRAFHQYIQQVMHPTFYRALAHGEVKADFYRPEILSSSFIVRNIHELYNSERKASGLEEIYYKLASINPRNPVNRADPFEANLIRRFNEDHNLKEYSTVITMNGRRYLYFAKPFLMNNEACMKCHGRRQDAPPGLQKLYPGEGGFNEKLGQIRAIESYRLPLGGEFTVAVIVTASLSVGLLVLMLLLLFNVRLRDLVRLQTRDLADEIEERKAKEAELERKNAELERFAYTVSHDLKSPLITIRGFSGALLKDVEKGRYDRLGKDLHRVMDAADKMSALLNDLLELSRIGRIVNPAMTVGMQELVAEAVDGLAGGLEEAGIEVVVQPDLPQVFVDRNRVVEVLQNLIENAVKYRGDQPAPRIEIGQRPDGVFFVRDNGIGIEACYLETIFGLFNKLDAKSEGTGIGLALVRRIVEFHGGMVWAESAGSGQGTTICFTLPATQVADGSDMEIAQRSVR